MLLLLLPVLFSWHSMQKIKLEDNGIKNLYAECSIEYECQKDLAYRTPTQQFVILIRIQQTVRKNL